VITAGTKPFASSHAPKAGTVWIANPEGAIAGDGDGDDEPDERTKEEIIAAANASRKAQDARDAAYEAAREAEARGDDDAGDDSAGDDNSAEQDSAGDADGDYKPNWIPGIGYRDVGTIGELRDYIEEAIRKGAKPDNQLHVAITFEEHGTLSHFTHRATVSFCDADGTEDDPPFMIVEPTQEDVQEMLKCDASEGYDLPSNFRKVTPTPDVTKLQQRITDLESKLAAAVAERERLHSENASLKLINQGLQKQEHAPPTVPGDDTASERIRELERLNLALESEVEELKDALKKQQEEHAPPTVPGDPTPELPSSGLGLRVDDEGVTHVPGKVYAQALKKHGHER
jgi:hypothetical protein